MFENTIIIVRATMNIIISMITGINNISCSIHKWCENIIPSIEDAKSKMINHLADAYAKKNNVLAKMKRKLHIERTIIVDEYTPAKDRDIIDTFREHLSTITIIDETGEIIYDRGVFISYTAIHECVANHNCIVISSYPSLKGISLRFVH